MTDPGDILDPELAALMAAEKRRPDPPEDVGARILERLSVVLPIGGGAATPAPGTRPDLPSSAAAPAAPSSGTPAAPVVPAGGGAVSSLLPLKGAARAWLIFAMGGATGAAGHAVYSRVVGPSPAEVSLSAPASLPSRPVAPVGDASASEVPGLDVLPEKTPASSVPSPAAPPERLRPPLEVAPSAPTSASPDAQMRAERKLLEMARTTMVRGQMDEALAYLRRHAQQFPAGELQEEREGLLIQALVRHGDVEAARRRAERFRVNFPHSLFGPAVEASIREIP